MKRVIYLSIIFAGYVEANIYDSFLEQREIDNNKKFQSKFLDKTRDALLSYDIVEERANYILHRVKNMTFGEYSDHVLYLAPIASGHVEMKVYDINVYYDHFAQKSGFKYKIEF